MPHNRPPSKIEDIRIGQIKLGAHFLIALKDLPKLRKAMEPDEVKFGFPIYNGGRDNTPEAA